MIYPSATRSYYKSRNLVFVTKIETQHRKNVDVLRNHKIGKSSWDKIVEAHITYKSTTKRFCSTSTFYESQHIRAVWYFPQRYKLKTVLVVSAVNYRDLPKS